jgi:hypothetical protein
MDLGSGMENIGYGTREKHPDTQHWDIDNHSLMYSKDNAQEVVTLRHPKIAFITHPNGNNKPFNETKDSSVRFCRIFNDQLCRWFRFAQLAKGKKFRP